MKEKFGIILLGTVMAICILLWCITGLGSMLLFVSTLSLMLFVHISFTTLCNALVGREFSAGYDLFWKLFFMITACVGYSIYFSI